MYLEINNRQSGKTERLIKAVIDHISAGGYAHVIGHNYEWAKRLEKMIRVLYPKNAKYIQLVVTTSHNPLVFSGLDPKFRRFWDEYAFCKNIIWREEDYYCTSYPDFEKVGTNPLILDTDKLFEQYINQLAEELEKDDKPKTEVKTNPSIFSKMWNIRLIAESELGVGPLSVTAENFETRDNFVYFYDIKGKVVNAIKEEQIVSISLIY